MALPVILVNTDTGSDTAASGAGPATALTGSAGISAGDGLSVNLDGSPDLSGVATDGSHVLFFNDTTAGNRNFVKITGTSGSGGPSATVTVADALGLALTKAWAIGGKRDSIGSTTSKKLFDNNGAAGDAMPGWIIEMEPDHTETITATIDLRRSGDTTSGPIILRSSGTGSNPVVLTFSNNGNAFNLRGSYLQLRNFYMNNSNATKTLSVAVNFTSTALNCVIEDLLFQNASFLFWKGVVSGGTNRNLILDCRIRSTTVGCDLACLHLVLGCHIHDCGSHGIQVVGDIEGLVIENNIIEGNSGDGIRIDSNNTIGSRSMSIVGNTIDSNAGDGIEFLDVMSDFMLTMLRNNILSANGGYGVHFSGASVTAIGLAALGFVMTHNNCWGNNDGDTLPAGISQNDPAADPLFSGGDFDPGVNLKGVGWPTNHIGRDTVSSVDIGAVQRAEPTMKFFLLSRF